MKGARSQNLSSRWWEHTRLRCADKLGRQLELETGEERELFEKPPKLLTDWILQNSRGRKTKDREYNQGLGKVQQTLEGGI